MALARTGWLPRALLAFLLVQVVLLQALAQPSYSSRGAGAPAAGLSVEKRELRFGRPRVWFDEKTGYHEMRVEGCDSVLLSPGRPKVPYASTIFKLELGSEVEEVSVIPGREHVLGGSYRLAPASRPVPLSSAKKGVASEPHELDQSVYGSDRPYPGKLYDYRTAVGIDPETHERVVFVFVNVYPVQYRPLSGRITYITEAKVIVRFLGPGKSAGQGQGASSSLDMVIITSPDLEDYAEDYADFKESLGTSCAVYTTDWIYEHFTGRDDQEKIRNFIKDFVEHLDIKFVLILGDHEVVPARFAYIPDGYADGNEAEDGSYVETDLYYADLQGTWDDNNDGLWGDLDHDNVDGVPDIFVGRIPASTTGEAEDILGKLMEYEGDVRFSEEWFMRVLLLGTDPFKEYAGAEGEIVKDYIEDNFIWANFSYTKLYETYGTLTREAVRSHIDSGYGFVNFMGHGSVGSWYLGSGGSYYSSDAASQTNGYMLPLVVAGACLTSRFAGYDCIGETFLLNDDGGAMAYFGSTRVAWGYTGYSVTDGLVGEMDWRFFQAFFSIGRRRVGAVWAEALKRYISAHPINTTYDGYYLDWKTVAEYGAPFGDPSMFIGSPLCADKKAPSIVSVQRSPSSPQYDEVVSVYARVQDADTGVKDVLLWFKAGDEEYTSKMVLCGSQYVGHIPAYSTGTQVSYRVYAVDKAGNVAESSIYTYTVRDTRDPMARIISPLSGSHVRGMVNVSIFAQDRFLSAAELWLNDTLLKSWTKSGFHDYELNTTELQDGLYALKLIARDKSGNQVELTALLMVDNTPPGAAIAEPSNNTFLRGEVELEVHVSDENFGSAELYVGGYLFETIDEAGIYEFTWNTSEWPDGRYLISLVVRDLAGNENRTCVEVVVDNTSPLAELIAADEGELVSGETGAYVWYYDVNLASVELLLDGEPLQPSLGWITINTTALPDGEHVLELVVVDEAGNEAFDDATFESDNTPPSATIMSPVNGSILDGTVVVNFTAQDEHLRLVLLYIDNASYDVTGSGYFVWDTAFAPDGWHTLRLVAVDEAGNVAEHSILVYTRTQELRAEEEQARISAAREEATEKAMRFYLSIGIPAGFLAGAGLSAIFLRRRS